MLNKYLIKEITDKQDPTLEQVGVLFGEMYEYMQAHGLKLELSPDGCQQWISSVSKGLGRFGVLYVIFNDDDIFGFAHGSIRLSPDYLGSKKLGVITHVFVRDNDRSSGAGRKLVNALEDWFVKQNIHSIELQVLSGNQPAIGFWEKLGYASELLQCRKVL
jgi:GNAT superfamily N-acetyltransferase